jgi:hypothetical protein
MVMLTEQEKKEILSKYDDNTSPELLTFLKRNFPIGETNLDWMKSPMKYVVVDDKIKYLDGNKKYLVNLIDSLVEDQWVGIAQSLRRRTIKKYIDGVSM